MAGLAELHDWVDYEDREWVCRPEEAEAALERITQAARYLVQVCPPRHLAGPLREHSAWHGRAAPEVAHAALSCQRAWQ